MSSSPYPPREKREKADVSRRESACRIFSSILKRSVVRTPIGHTRNRFLRRIMPPPSQLSRDDDRAENKLLSSSSASSISQIRALLRRLSSNSSSLAGKIDAVESMLELSSQRRRRSGKGNGGRGEDGFTTTATQNDDDDDDNDDDLDNNNSIPWAIDIVRANAVLPLLGIVQSVRRNALTLEPIEEEEEEGEGDADALRLADSALLLLAELANVGQSVLESVGFEVIRDEETGMCAYVHEESGMRTNELPRVSAMMDDTDDEEGDWPLDVLCECVSLLAPSGVDEKRGEVLWQVKVVDFTLGEEEKGEEDLAVVDVALEEEGGGADGRDVARALIRGSWRGSNGKVEGEVNPEEVLGCALDAWKDAMFASAVHMARERKRKKSLNSSVSLLSSSPTTVLIFGLRDGSLPTFLARRYPPNELECVVVENDNRVVEFAEKHFKFSSKQPGVEVKMLLPMNEYSSDAETRDFKCDVVLVSDGAQYPVEKYVNLEGLTIPVVAVANAKTLPHANILEPTWLGPNIVRCVDPSIEANAEEDVEVEVEVVVEEDASRAAKRRKQSGLEEEENTKKVDAFFKRYSVKSTDLLLFNCGSEQLMRASKETKLENLPFFIDSIDRVPGAWNVGGNTSAEVEKMESFTVAFAENEDDGFEDKSAHQYNASHARKNLDTSNAAFSLFGDDDDNDNTTEKQEVAVDEDVAARWERLSESPAQCASYFTRERIAGVQDRIKSTHDWSRFQKDVRLLGYASPKNSANVTASKEEEKELLIKFSRVVETLKRKGYPATLAFVTDVAWEIVLKLWTIAEEVYDHEEVVLEPSFAAYALEKPASILEKKKSENGNKKYVGQNFGQPHRDYARDDDALSLWLPLNDVDVDNGCIYVLPKEHDHERNASKSGGHKSKPDFPIEKAVALAPVEGGRVLGWSGDVVHWGTSCQASSALPPRQSIGVAFRKKKANDATGTVGKTPSMTKSEAFSLDVAGRLKAITVALGAFEHWYGSTNSIKAKIS